jgi:hypothetical protein
VNPAFSEESELITGPQIARIIVPRAIVYSDENMNSPLGYISNDKLITVGNPRKKNPDLVPLVVYGRLAFIELKNIHYESELAEQLHSKRGAPQEHNIDDVLIKPEEKLSENNSAYFNLHQFYGGKETSDLFESVDGTAKDNFTGIGINFLHRQRFGRAIWGAGFDYNFLSSENIDFTYFLISPFFGYTPMRTKLFLVDFVFSIDFSANSQLNLNNNFVTEPAPFIYGPQLLARLVFLPDQNYHITGELGYRSYKVLRVENLQDANDASIGGVTKLSGVNIGIGLAIEL